MANPPPIPPGFAPMGIPPIPPGFSPVSESLSSTDIKTMLQTSRPGRFLESLVEGGRTASNVLGGTAEMAAKVGPVGGVVGVPALMAQKVVDIVRPETRLQAAVGLASSPISEAAIATGGKLLAPFASKIAPAMKSIIQIAREKGIPLTAADITNSQTLANFESFLQKTPFGSGVIQKFRETQMNALKNARDALLAKFGPSSEAHEAGQGIIDLIKEASQKFKTKSDDLYAQLRQIAPGDTEIGIFNLQNKAAELLRAEKKLPQGFRDSTIVNQMESLVNFGKEKIARIHGASEEASQFILSPTGDKLIATPSERTIGVLKNSMPLDALLGLRSTIGQKIVDNDAAIKAGQSGIAGMGKKIAGVYKTLMSKINEDLEIYSRINPKFKDAFDLARSTYVDFKSTFNNKIIRRLINTNPERVVNSLIKPGNVTEIKALRSAAGQEGFDTLRQKLAEKILGQSESDMSPMALNKGLSKYGKETLQALFNPEELRSLANLGNVSSKVLTAERLAGNPSGTARTVISGGQLGLMLASPIKGTIVVLGQIPLAKLYMSRIGRQYLSEGLTLPAGSAQAAKLATRITAYLSAKQSQK